MRTQLVFAVVLLATVTAVLARPEDKYTDRWDGIDLDQILNSDRLLTNYFNCLLEKGKCTPDGSELKRTLPDALETECSKCTKAQKSGSDKVITYLIKNKKDWWTDLEKKYDPTGIYRAAHPEYFV